MQQLHLHSDIETYCDLDLKKVGLYKYVSHESFCILMIAYSYGDDPVEIVDVENGEDVPDQFLADLCNPKVLKFAFNANFERTAYDAFFKIKTPINSWRCVMVKAACLGLPLKLEVVARVLNLPQQKDTAGTILINYFAKPCKPSKANDYRTRNLPHHDLVKWQQFKDYCVQDVYTEQAVHDKIDWYEIPEEEQRLWCLDQEINDRGVMMDKIFIKQAIKISSAIKKTLIAEAVELTGLQNPNSVKQLIKWLSEEMDEEILTLKKDELPDLLKRAKTDTIRRVLQIRDQTRRASVTKYTTMLGAICSTGRIYGLFQFCGANRTWRWAGRLVQAQNLRRIKIKDVQLARDFVLAGDVDALELFYGDVTDIISQLIRTAFVAEPGKKLIVDDFSAIEMIISAYLTDTEWKIEEYKGEGKIYEIGASKMFNVPLELVTKTSDERQAGKVAELALGYQGGPNALQQMEKSILDGKHLTQKTEDAARLEFERTEEVSKLVSVTDKAGNKTKQMRTMRVYADGLEEGEAYPYDTADEAAEAEREAELKKIVKLWRKANKNTVQYWYMINKAAIYCVKNQQHIRLTHGLEMYCKRGIFFIQLPSGRCLAYARPQIKNGEYGEGLSYYGLDQKTNQWVRIDTYGGKLVENIVQGFARDCLAHKMLKLADAGCKIVLHVHDEVVLEEPDEAYDWNIGAVSAIMQEPIPWAPDLPLKAEGFETYFYKKD